jgi:hypothetical protein
MSEPATELLCDDSGGGATVDLVGRCGMKRSDWRGRRKGEAAGQLSLLHWLLLLRPVARRAPDRRQTYMLAGPGRRVALAEEVSAVAVAVACHRIIPAAVANALADSERAAIGRLVRPGDSFSRGRSVL